MTWGHRIFTSMMWSACSWLASSAIMSSTSFVKCSNSPSPLEGAIFNFVRFFFSSTCHADFRGGGQFVIPLCCETNVDLVLEMLDATASCSPFRFFSSLPAAGEALQRCGRSAFRSGGFFSSLWWQASSVDLHTFSACVSSCLQLWLVG